MAELVKPGPHAQLNRAHPFAQGLCAYWPFTEGAGKRPVEFVTGWQPTTSANTNSTRWSAGRPGLTYAPISSDYSSGTNNMIFRTPFVNGISSVTLGLLAVFNVRVATQPARIITCGGIELRMSSDGTIDQHCRVDFIANTSYARPNTGQFSTGDLRTIFCTRVPGAAPNVLTGLWPDKPLAAPTYFDRGSASGTCGAATCTILGQDFSGVVWSDTTVYWIGIWNRVLARDEMESLHHDPWQMIVPPLPYTLFAPVGGWISRVGHDGPPAARVVC